ncbi:MAG TPA: type II toxin-antitoxin system VapC family toxin [Actinomycetota bacterium]|nr:type II toxin-antitoxin system VapC family toxin [Actinomycetota bacterium]
MTAELLYLDSSAIVKLISRESESTALATRLAEGPDVVTSALAQVEVLRAMSRVHASRTEVRRAEAVLGAITMLRIDDIVLERAATIRPVTLRSLDAIHLASAVSVGETLTALVTYDARLASAAEGLGVDVLTPSDQIT